MHAIDAVYDDVIAAIKKKIRFNYGSLPLSGSAYMRYTGMTKQIEQSGDIFKPDSVTLTVTVHYQSTDTATGPTPLQEEF